MKKFTKGLRPIIAIIIAITLTITVAAAIVIAREWGNATLFRGCIEQPEDAAVELVLYANGEEFTNGALLTDGEYVEFPIMEPTHHTSDGVWWDENGTCAVKAPTITVATRGGVSMDTDVFYKVQVHSVYAESGEYLPAGVAEALKFKFIDNYYDVDGNLVGGADTDEAHSLLMQDGYAETSWQHIPQATLQDGGYVTVDISAYATAAAEGEFFVSIIFASGDWENALGHIPAEPIPIEIPIPVGES